MSNILDLIDKELMNFNDLTDDPNAYTLKELCEAKHCGRDRMKAFISQKVKDGVAITGFKRHSNGKAKAYKLK